MKKYIIIALIIPSLMSFTLHKYYLSVTDVEYNAEAKSVQLITRIFYDDLEDVLNERYDKNFILSDRSDQEEIDNYLKKYLTSKIKIRVNDELKKLQFVGKEYEDDYVVCYIETSRVDSITKFEIENELLIDLFPEQKNMIHTKIYKRQKSFLLTRESAKAMLNFSE